MERAEAIERIRRFNRTYLPFMSLFDQNYLGTGYSITDTRVLFEIDGRGECSARELSEALGLDKGYLSRMLRRFETDGLIARHAAPTDGRVMLIALTEAGEGFLSELTAGGNELVGRVLERATDEQCAQIARNMDEIIALLRDVTKAKE